MEYLPSASHIIRLEIQPEITLIQKVGHCCKLIYGWLMGLVLYYIYYLLNQLIHSNVINGPFVPFDYGKTL